jgi:uncharacterized membrane protein
MGLLPGGCFSLPNAINSSGMMVGAGDIGVIDPGTGLPMIHADIRTGGQIIDLGTFGGAMSLANHVNDRGEVTGFATNTDPDPLQVFSSPQQQRCMLSFGTPESCETWRPWAGSIPLVSSLMNVAKSLDFRSQMKFRIPPPVSPLLTHSYGRTAG